MREIAKKINCIGADRVASSVGRGPCHVSVGDGKYTGNGGLRFPTGTRSAHCIVAVVCFPLYTRVENVHEPVKNSHSPRSIGAIVVSIFYSARQILPSKTRSRPTLRISNRSAKHGFRLKTTRGMAKPCTGASRRIRFRDGNDYDHSTPCIILKWKNVIEIIIFVEMYLDGLR